MWDWCINQKITKKNHFLIYATSLTSSVANASQLTVSLHLLTSANVDHWKAAKAVLTTLLWSPVVKAHTLDGKAVCYKEGIVLTVLNLRARLKEEIWDIFTAVAAKGNLRVIQFFLKKIIW